MKRGLKVGANGRVVSVEVVASPGSAMGSCVASVVFNAVVAYLTAIRIPRAKKHVSELKNIFAQECKATS